MVESSSWSRALTLLERDVLHPSDAVPAAFEVDLAGRRIEAWKQEAFLSDRDHFALRLEQQGFDETRFAHLLGSPAPPLDSTPSWLRQLEIAYTAQAEATHLESFWKEAVAAQADAVFLDVVRPLLDHAWCQLTARLADLDGNGLDNSSLDVTGKPVFDAQHFAQLWAKPLPTQFLWMVRRTLILELYLSRLQNNLVGETPEARFDSFVASLRDPSGAFEFLSTYPVLGRNLATRLEQWLEVGVELAQRLIADLPQLTTTFGDRSIRDGAIRDGSLGELVGLDPGLGDRHRGGRTVVILEFSSGIRVVYKPRTLALDFRFQQLLTWLGDEGIQPKPRTLRVIDRTTHGWVEFVEAAPCQNKAEIERFYARQGMYLALLYALEATDFHHENVIAVGEHPVLIDLETIFQPVLADANLQRERINPVFTTILRNGLLPRLTGGGGEDGWVDLSGLGARHGQRTPISELTQVGTDAMSYVDSEQDFPVGKHLPSLHGEHVPLRTMRSVLSQSFETTYRKLMDLRDQFLCPGGWIDSFANMETRVVVRPTNVYASLNYRSYHPDYLQDSLHRERFIDKLWLDADLLEWIPQVIPAERRDLLRGDVPLFSTRTDSTDLYCDDFRLSQVLPESGLDLTRRRVASLNEDDLERQLALLRLSLASTRRLDEPAEDDLRALRDLPAPRTKSRRQQSDFLDAARDVGKRLETLAFDISAWSSWFHLESEPNGTQSLQPVGLDLYAGLSGIALFYAQLGQLTAESHWTEIARCTLETARRRHGEPSEEQPRRALGGYSGLGGWIYTLTYLGVLWGEEEFFEVAETARDQVFSSVEDDAGLDIVAGSAGCIAGLLALHRHRPSKTTLDAALACGDHLLATAEDQEHGKAWRILTAERPLVGFAHGTAGIAWALARLAAETQETRFEDMARSALVYERNLFSPQHDNWPDLRMDRADEEGWAYFHAWCHGSPGIGLGRLAMMDVLEDPQLESEIRAAVRSTGEEGFGGSHCLCHGDLGNFEFLVRAGQRLDDPKLCARADQLAEQILSAIERDGYRCGLSSHVELPGLMTGLAGIGYGLLRIAAPQSVPSVLLLETPDTSS